MLNSEIELTEADRAQLAQTISSQGWRIIKKIMEAEVEKFSITLLNVAPGCKSEMIDRWYLAKSAAQVVAGVFQRLQGEMEIYRAGADNKIIPDVTESVLDFGEIPKEDEIV